MRIQHNIMAMSAYRNYTNNVSAMKKNLEKLSSGYKINRAGDDAAGLAISEKMRAQITGLETAQKNAKDGISLVQTAEGALTEVHDMLNRMVELATMSANGTYDNTTDRAQLQKEMDQLRSEINRIADSSNFNGIKLLNGDMDGADTVVESPVQGVTVTAVLDGNQSGAAGTVGVYSIDLKDLVVFNGGTPGQAVTAVITLGSTAIGTFAMTGATMGGANFAASGTWATSISIDGISYNIAVSGTKITLTGVSVPGSSASYAASLSVTIAAIDANGAAVLNAGVDFSVHVDNAPQVDSKHLLAHGSFSLSKADIADGAKLKIGDETYVFAVGESKVKAGDGEKLIDLTKIDADDPNLLRYAVEKLTQQDNSKFHITTGNVADQPSTVQIDLTEKAGAVDYKTEWNLKGDDSTTASTSNGIWNTKVGSTDPTTGVVTKQAAPTTTPGDKNKGLTLQIGDTADSYNQLKVDIKDMHTKAMQIDTISIADQTSAAAAVDAIKKAINYVSDVRGTLGATQNRLDHTINNLSVMTENIQDAESTIRDTDVAEEMMAYTKNNILIQSAQAMLAQANQVPQGVLQLLQ